MSGRSDYGSFEVIQENVQCVTGYSSCVDSVEVIIRGESIKLTRGNTPYTDSREFYVTSEGGMIVVHARSIDLAVKWDHSTGLYVNLGGSFRGKVCGLCGNFDGDYGNDFTTSEGALTRSANTFAESWRAGGKCPGPSPIIKLPCRQHPERQAVAVEDCSVIKSAHFSTCQGALDLQKMYDNCVYDVCSGLTVTMKDPSCEAIKTASMKCKEKTGKAVSWGQLERKCACQRKQKSGKCCHFPFEFRGVTFYDCVPQVHRGSPWCSSGKRAYSSNSAECQSI